MSRVAPAQTDLFAPAQPHLPAWSESASPPPDPLVELRALLDIVKNATVLPWPDAAAAMIEERRALWLAQQAGDEGATLVAAIFQETERLFSAAERGDERPPSHSAISLVQSPGDADRMAAPLR